MQGFSCACALGSIALLLSGCGSSSTITPECDTPWSYRDFQAWSNLPKGMCGHTNDQSPIDIVHADVSEDHNLRDIVFEMTEETTHVSLLYDLKTWQANTPRGAAGVTFQGKEFRLIQFHFHSPSENTLDGLHGAMESHFVNVASDGQILVVAVLWDIGAESPILSHLEGIVAPQVGINDPVTIPNPYHFTVGLDQSFYHYTGSLTTPPCTNGTEWVVLRHRGTLSAEQLAVFRHDLSDPACTMLAEQDSEYPDGVPHSAWDPKLGVNNRPTQPLAGRAVRFHTYSAAAAAEPSNVMAAQEPDVGDRSWKIWAVLSSLSLLSAASGAFIFKGRAKRHQDEQLLPPPAEVGYGAFPPTA